IQGGVDASYGIGYVGAWFSNLDFGKTGGKDIANAEVDVYAGIKPVLGPVTFDLGVIYYAYPAARDSAAELDYVELKLGASMTPIDKLTAGAVFYWSPDYTGETGDVYTVEGTLAYALPKVWVFDPTISGRFGYQKGDEAAYAVLINGDDNYMYWDAGITLAVEKIAFDFRYIDTDISNAGGFCEGALFQCDATFLASVKITLP
ncbi:MAG: TorF family putative porin, partial [Hyphomicrobium sp.]